MSATRIRRAMLCVALAGASPAAVAQEPAQTAAPAAALPAAPETPTAPVEPAAATLTIPALTPVELEILATVSSRTSQTGESFPIRLAKPIMLGDVVAVPAGATGMGEVVHAKKSGASGAGGELIVAARFIDVDGRHLKLRSMRVLSNGRDQTGLAMATSAAIGIFALAVTGKNTEIPAGIHADAKVAEDFVLPAPPATPAPRAETPPAAQPSQQQPSQQGEQP